MMVFSKHSPRVRKARKSQIRDVDAIRGILGAKVLLVEDNKAHAGLMCRAFEAHEGRFHVTVACSLAEVRARLAVHSIMTSPTPPIVRVGTCVPIPYPGLWMASF